MVNQNKSINVDESSDIACTRGERENGNKRLTIGIAGSKGDLEQEEKLSKKRWRLVTFLPIYFLRCDFFCQRLSVFSQVAIGDGQNQVFWTKHGISSKTRYLRIFLQTFTNLAHFHYQGRVKGLFHGGKTVE